MSTTEGSVLAHCVRPGYRPEQDREPQPEREPERSDTTIRWRDRSRSGEADAELEFGLENGEILISDIWEKLIMIVK